IGLTFRAFAGTVVVPELDQDVVGFGSQDGFPAFFTTETFRTAAIQREVQDFDMEIEGSAEAGSPASFVVDRRVADQCDLDGGEGQWSEQQQEGSTIEHGEPGVA